MQYFSREENEKGEEKKIDLVSFILVTKKYKDKKTTLPKIRR